MLKSSYADVSLSVFIPQCDRSKDSKEVSVDKGQRRGMKGVDGQRSAEVTYVIFLKDGYNCDQLEQGLS